MADGKALGVAVIGLGVGEQHARQYRKLDGCVLRWLVDLDADRAAQLAASLDVPQHGTAFAEVLDDPAVDVVSLATFDDAHFEQVLAALRAGKHVFVEKPICRTSEEARLVKRAWLEAGGSSRALASNLVLRSAPLYRRLRRAIDEKRLGRIFAMDGEYLYGRLHKITDGWRTRVDDYSVMTGGGVHMIDLLLWLTGARPVWIEAAGNRIATENTAFRYLDFVTSIAGMADGALARYTANFGCAHRHQHVLRLYGTEATFLYDDAGARLHDTRDPAAEPERWTESPLPSSKGDLIPDFVQGIQAHRDWGPDVQAALDVISVCAACDEALKRDRKVQVSYS